MKYYTHQALCNSETVSAFELICSLAEFDTIMNSIAYIQGKTNKNGDIGILEGYILLFLNIIKEICGISWKKFPACGIMTSERRIILNKFD